MGGSNPTEDTWLHIYMSVLHFLKEYILFKGRFEDDFHILL